MKTLLAITTMFFVFAVSVSAHGQSIHMTKDGFQPSELIIQKGESVIFENTDSELKFWPASDLHPSHAIYSEFDPKKPLDPGETWEFEFNRVGEWKFHDHLYPKFTGVIKVEGTPDSESHESKTLTDKFKDVISEVKLMVVKIYYKVFPAKLTEIPINKFVDDEEKLTFYIRLLGPDGAMDKLLTESDGGNIFDCHRQAHVIGRVSYEVFGPEVFGKGNSSCHSGYYHGAMESFLHEEGTENLAEKIDSICSQFTSNFGNFECLHGVGHGVMAYESYDLPKAIEVCKQLGGDFETSSCYGGVFMENVVAAQGNASVIGHTTTWVSDDPHYPCNEYNDNFRAQRECYMMQTSRMLMLLNRDYKKVADECLRSAEGQVITCFQSLGRDGAGDALRDPDKIIETCSNVPEDYRRWCYGGALNVIIEFWGERLQNQGEEFCGKLATNYKDECLGQTASRKVDIFGDP